MDSAALLGRWRRRLGSGDATSFLVDCPEFLRAIFGANDLADRARGLLEAADSLGREHQEQELEQDDADARLLEDIWLRLVDRSEPGRWLMQAVQQFDAVYEDRAFPAAIAFDPQVRTDAGRLGTLLDLIDKAAKAGDGAAVLDQYSIGLGDLRSQQDARHRAFLLAAQRNAGIALLRLQFVAQALTDSPDPVTTESRPPHGMGRPALTVRELGEWGWPTLIRESAESPASPAPTHVPGLVERLQPLAEILCSELEDEAYAVAVPFHVRITTDEARRRLDRTDQAFAFHQSEDQLRARFVDPWTKRQDIVCSGLTFEPGHTRIEILRDPNYSSQPFRDESDWKRSSHEPGVRDVTDDFLTHRVATGSRLSSDPSQDAPIFIVHGRNELRKTETARLVERCTDRDAKILHEQADRGRTVIEKFEQHAAGIAFAVILMTADDVGGISPTELNPRARQNVVFEHGFFAGLIGRDRVAVLCDADVERPSDIGGLVYIPIDDAGRWKFDLLDEIEAAGITVDRARVV